MSRTTKIAYAAMLLSIYVLSVRLIGLLQPGPIFSFNRLGIGIAIIMFGSVILGPFYGALIGVAGDALGWLILGQWTGAFNVFLSVYYAIIGVLPWVVVRLSGPLLKKKYSLLSFSIGLGAVWAVLAVLLWAPGIFDAGFARWNLDIRVCRIVVTALTGVLAALTIVGIHFLQKKTREGVHMGEVAWISLVVELATIFLKPLAFYVYCLVFLGTDIAVAWNIDYGTLVLISILFAFPDLFINIGSLRLFLWIQKKALPHGRQEEA